MKTLVSKTHNIGICPKGLILGFGQKCELLLTFRFFKKCTKKKYLVTFSLDEKPF